MIANADTRASRAPRKAGVEALHVPGDMERVRARRQMTDGVAYEPFILEDLRNLADLVGISLDF